MKLIFKLLLISFISSFLMGSPYYESMKSNDFELNAKANLKDKVSSFNKLAYNDVHYKKQWYLKFTNSDVAALEINQKVKVKVAVVDTGIDYRHIDLKNRVNKDLGYDFVNDDDDALDDDGHGTAIAGIIAAEGNNKEGIVGVVGMLAVELIPIKVLDNKGIGNSLTVARGVRYAADIGSKVINLSVDFKNMDKYIKAAIDYAANKGILVVVASGNNNGNCDLYSPAGDKNAYTVASVGALNKKSTFSSYGSNVSIAAPGEKIYTTGLNNSYSYKSGTSMSAPIVTGVAAMIYASDFQMSRNKVIEILDKSSKDILFKGKDKYSGFGIVDTLKAIILAKRLII